MGTAEQLRELHDTYVWEVNAAVGEDRPDLVWRLAEEYLDRALQLVTADEPTGCGRPDCTVCTGRREPRPGPRRRARFGWGRRRER